MAHINLQAIRTAIEHGLRASPEAIAAVREADAIEARREAARYAALSGTEKREYDALTKGMMPRLGV